jgi:3-dehydroquinate dehydratase / shikimate dehydrogenase
VVVGVGHAGVMLALIGRKVGAPWAPAALEKGMEAYPGQPTVSELVDEYRYREIGKKTRFVGVVGTGPRSHRAAGLLNAAFALLDMPHRALPMAIGNRRHFRRIAAAVRLQGVFLDEDNYEGLHEVGMLDDTARAPVLAGDFLAPADDGWAASNLLGPAAVAAIEAAIRAREPGGSLRGRTVVLAGCGALTRMLAFPLKAAGASLIWASRKREAAQSAGQTFGGRQVLWDAVYVTSHDVLVIGRDGGKSAAGEPEPDLPFHPGYLKPGMIVLDLTAEVSPTRFMAEAASRMCAVVSPDRLLVEQVRGHVRRLGGEVPAAVLEEKLTAWAP